MDEIAAIKIQSSFRCYKARRALRALKGIVRLKRMIEGESIKHQTKESLKCMQTHSRVQSQIFARRIRLSEENVAFQRQLQLKNEKELEKLKACDGENWNGSTQIKEKMEANLQSKQEAAQRRERAMAYAYSHQQTWRNSCNKLFLDSNNPHSGWSWMGQWMAIRTREHKTSTETKSSGSSVLIKCTSKKTVLSGDGNRAIRQPSPKSKTPSSLALRDTKLKSFLSTRGSERGTDEDSRSILSARSEYFQRRCSIASSSIRDNESFSSTPPAFPSYMAPTESAKAKSRLPSLLGIETLDKGSVSSIKKRLSFSGSPNIDISGGTTLNHGVSMDTS